MSFNKRRTHLRRLDQVLKFHSSASHPMALKRNLGDAYLLEHNLIFANIRRAARRCGYRYSDKNTENYSAHSFSQLPEIIRTKSIPYFDNVTVLKRLNSRHPQKIDWQEIRQSGLIQNFILHESSHGIARQLTRRHLGPLLKVRKSHRITGFLLEESFANTCEFMASLFATQPIHQIFFNQNSYWTTSPEAKQWRPLLSQIGLEGLARFTILCFLHSNFLYQVISKNRTKLFYELANPGIPIDRRSLTRLHALGKETLRLNPWFRLMTSRLYFKLLGFQGSIENNLRFDFLTLMQNEPRYFQCLDAMASAMAKPEVVVPC